MDFFMAGGPGGLVTRSWEVCSGHKSIHEELGTEEVEVLPDGELLFLFVKVRDGQLLKGTSDQSEGIVLDDLQFLYVCCTDVWLEDRCAVVDDRFDQSLPGQEEGFPVLTQCGTQMTPRILRFLSKGMTDPLRVT
jgi:hypothetical protein